MDEAQLVSVNELKAPKRYCGQDMQQKSGTGKAAIEQVMARG